MKKKQQASSLLFLIILLIILLLFLIRIGIVTISVLLVCSVCAAKHAPCTTLCAAHPLPITIRAWASVNALDDAPWFFAIFPSHVVIQFIGVWWRVGKGILNQLAFYHGLLHFFEGEKTTPLMHGFDLGNGAPRWGIIGWLALGLALVLLPGCFAVGGVHR
jgi:hypothetical protein